MTQVAAQTMGSATNSRIVARYRERTPGSERLALRARSAFPSGIAHDTRNVDPWPIYVARGARGRKWDVDGNELVDYMGGHGALLLGHNFPAVTAAVQRQMELGTHFGACHELEVRWAELVQQLIPSAERVRFTASGTEATMLAIRLARAHTGKTRIVRFAGHFHGWHDHLAAAYVNRFDGSAPVGVPEAVAEGIVVLPPNDEAAVTRTLEERDDIAAVILEPTGASWGHIPTPPSFLALLRRLTAARGVVLIFDEVISGFRAAPGGAQEAFGIRPDLTTLAKILAGGLPGGAVAGRKDVLDHLDFAATRAAGREKILHFGTFNANPVSAAAGVAALEAVATTDACARANDYGARMRDALNAIIVEAGVPWAAYGTFSAFHIFTNPKGRAVDPASFDPYAVPYDELRSGNPQLVNKLRLGMLNEGVDLNGWPGGFTFAAHDDADFARTTDAFSATLRALRDEGDL